GRAARRANALLHLGRQAAQVEVAGHGLNPGVGHANDGFAEIVIRKSNGLEHGAGGGPVAPISDTAAAMLRIHRVRRLRQGEGKEEIRKKRFKDFRSQISDCIWDAAQSAKWRMQPLLQSEIARSYTFTTLGSSRGAGVAFFASFCSHDIMARSFAPTSSMGCFFSASRRAANFFPPVLFSSIHSRAKVPS